MQAESQETKSISRSCEFFLISKVIKDELALSKTGTCPIWQLPHELVIENLSPQTVGTPHLYPFPY